MIPKYLYHYTSIDTLIKILENKTIRFTRLDKLNDPLEGFCANEMVKSEYKQLCKLTFVSCWTAEEKESIPMWYIYTEMKGVRIKIKSNMFAQKFDIFEGDGFFYPVQHVKDEMPTLFLCNKMVHGPIAVQYKDKNSLHNNICKHSITIDGNDCNKIDFFEYSVEKVIDWSYENEYRFRLPIFMSIQTNNDDIAFLSNYSFDCYPEYVDVPLCSTTEEIVLGEKVSSFEHNNLKEFLNKNSLNIPIKNSNIRTRF
mgnify:CR=1 FL=1